VGSEVETSVVNTERSEQCGRQSCRLRGGDDEGAGKRGCL
jgi:hypothetical protein